MGETPNTAHLARLNCPRLFAWSTKLERAAQPSGSHSHARNPLTYEPGKDAGSEGRLVTVVTVSKRQ